MLKDSYEEKLEDLIHDAWVIIANVNQGDWQGETYEWVEASEKWRDRYHKIVLRNRLKEVEVE